MSEGEIIYVNAACVYRRVVCPFVGVFVVCLPFASGLYEWHTWPKLEAVTVWVSCGQDKKGNKVLDVHLFSNHKKYAQPHQHPTTAVFVLLRPTLGIRLHSRREIIIFFMKSEEREAEKCTAQFFLKEKRSHTALKTIFCCAKNYFM